MRRFLLLSLLPSLAFGQVLERDTAVGTFTTAPTMPGATSTGTIETKGLVSTALDTPVNATFTAGTGSLPNATYYARISACNAAGCTVPSTETSLAITTGGVNYNWGTVTGATSYKVYCRTTGAEQLCATVTAPTTTWLDDGSVTPSGAIPALGTSGNVSSVSSMTARDFTASAAGGANAFSMATNARFVLNTAGDYLRNDGTYTHLPSIAKASSYTGGSSVPFSIVFFENNDANASAVNITSNNETLTQGYLLSMSPSTSSADWRARISFAGTYTVDGTDASGTPGSATINQPAGQVSVAASASSVVVTDSLVGTTSIVIPVLQFIDATCTQILSCVPAAGSFTITMNAACTANTKVGFIINNYF